MSVLGLCCFPFFWFCFISAPLSFFFFFERRHFSVKTKRFTVLQLRVCRIPTPHPQKTLRQRFLFSVDMTLHSIYWYHKVFFAYKEVMHSSSHFLNEFTCVVFYCFVLFFFCWCWCESQNIRLIGWNISRRDPWDLSIHSFVRGLLILQFEGKQKWKLILWGEHSLVIDMQHICPWQTYFDDSFIFFKTIIKSMNSLNLLNSMIFSYDSSSHLFEPLVPWTSYEQTWLVLCPF